MYISCWRHACLLTCHMLPGSTPSCRRRENLSQLMTTSTTDNFGLEIGDEDDDIGVEETHIVIAKVPRVWIGAPSFTQGCALILSHDMIPSRSCLFRISGPSSASERSSGSKRKRPLILKFTRHLYVA